LGIRVIDKRAVEIPAELLSQVEDDEEVVVLLEVVGLLFALFLIDVVLVDVDIVNKRLSCVVLSLEVLSLNHDGFLEQDVFIRVEDHILEKERPIRDHFQRLVITPGGQYLSPLVHIVNDEVGDEEYADEAEPRDNPFLAASF
jgi:hypothetical protein